MSVASVTPIVADSPVQIIQLEEVIGGRMRHGRQSRLYGPELRANQGNYNFGKGSIAL